MKSKEEIRNEIVNILYGCNGNSAGANLIVDYVYDVMEEYTSQQAPASTPPVSAEVCDCCGSTDNHLQCVCHECRIMQDGKDNRVFTDEYGKQWLTNKNGELVKDEFGNNIPPTQSTKTQTSSGFTTYDTSQGHCPFCGRLTCHGSCFK